MTKKPKLRRITFSDKLSKQFKDAKPELYLYRLEDTGELVEVQMAYGELLEREECGQFLQIPDGSYARRALDDEFQRDCTSTRSKTVRMTRPRWPMVSVNAGVNPSQVGELRQFWKSRGITGCEVLKNGDVVYHDRASRKADHLARGMFDKSGGYGDAMPQNL